jgi:spermidine synthase
MPQTIVHGKTRLGQSYEVNLENGIKVLNSENANYSFGSLHQIMLKGINEVLKKSKPSNILMLGLGAGSALSILANKCRHPFKVTIIEIDPDLVDVARQHFELDRYSDVEIITGDVKKEIKNQPESAYDLIIDDIFWDNRMPDFCLTQEYLSDNSRTLTPKGIYMRNTMNMEPEENITFEQHLASAFSRFYSLTHSEHNNKIYFCHR